MVKNELRRAIREKDWDSAKQLDGLLNSELERAVKIRKARAEQEQIRAATAKILAESNKLNAEAGKIVKDTKFGFAPLLLAASTIVVSVGTFIKSFFSK